MAKKFISLILLLFPISLKASSFMDIGLEAGPLFMNFAKDKVDGKKPSEIYSAAPLLSGIRVAAFPEESSNGILLRLLNGSSEVTTNNTTYTSYPGLSFLGAISYHHIGTSRFYFFTAIGIALIDFGLVRAKDPSAETSYTRGYSMADVDAILGFNYSIATHWQISTELELISNPSLYSYAAPLGLSLTLSYRLTDYSERGKVSESSRVI